MASCFRPSLLTPLLLATLLLTLLALLSVTPVWAGTGADPVKAVNSSAPVSGAANSPPAVNPPAGGVTGDARHTQSAAVGDNLESRYAKADLVSIVKVKFISDLVNPTLSIHGLVAIEGYMYTAEIIRNWKDVALSHLKVRVDLSHCRTRLQADSEYVVFGYRTGYDRFQSYSCDDLVPRQDAKHLILALDKVHQLRLAKRTKQPTSPI